MPFSKFNQALSGDYMHTSNLSHNEIFVNKKYAGRYLLEGRRMEHHIHPPHGRKDAFIISHIPQVELHLRSPQGITHLILFFSSREKIRISPISVCRNLLKTAFPKVPVPPVIISVLPLNIYIPFFAKASQGKLP
jgi:hypothetical protein